MTNRELTESHLKIKTKFVRVTVGYEMKITLNLFSYYEKTFFGLFKSGNLKIK